MASKLEILSQVMLSLKDDQNNAMNDINALLNNSSKEKNLINAIKVKIRSLSLIHSDMQETQSFIIQLTAESLTKEVDNGNIGSTGDIGSKENQTNDNST